MLPFPMHTKKSYHQFCVQDIRHEKTIDNQLTFYSNVVVKLKVIFLFRLVFLDKQF